MRRIALSLARDWGLDATFSESAGEGCRWINPLVDRIVSAVIEPVGAVAEPYALWAIQGRPGFEAILPTSRRVATDRLLGCGNRKLFLLNLGHTALVELWRQGSAWEGLTVREAILDPAIVRSLDAIYDEEVIPVFGPRPRTGSPRLSRPHQSRHQAPTPLRWPPSTRSGT